MTQPRQKPPFRADHVGSLLRPRELFEARAAWHAGRLPYTALRRIENDYVRRSRRHAGERGSARDHGWRFPPRRLVSSISCSACAASRAARIARQCRSRAGCISRLP